MVISEKYIRPVVKMQVRKVILNSSNRKKVFPELPSAGLHPAHGFAVARAEDAPLQEDADVRCKCAITKSCVVQVQNVQSTKSAQLGLSLRMSANPALHCPVGLKGLKGAERHELCSHLCKQKTIILG